MPLPFSFSTQRQSSEAASPAEPIAMAIAEQVMNFAPGLVRTEPMPGAVGSPFAVPAPSRAPVNAAHLPFAQGQEVAPAAPPLALPPPSAAGSATVHDLPAQIEQLRNDIFGIAMNTSALNDRLDRMEQRLPQTGQSMQASIAALRSEIESWLENHLNAAVEHCMHQIINRTQSAANRSVN